MIKSRVRIRRVFICFERVIIVDATRAIGLIASEVFYLNQKCAICRLESGDKVIR